MRLECRSGGPPLFSNSGMLLRAQVDLGGFSRASGDGERRRVAEIYAKLSSSETEGGSGGKEKEREAAIPIPTSSLSCEPSYCHSPMFSTFIPVCIGWLDPPVNFPLSCCFLWRFPYHRAAVAFPNGSLFLFYYSFRLMPSSSSSCLFSIYLLPSSPPF